MMNEAELKSKGYKYDTDKDWWSRTWSTNEGAENVQQVAAFTGNVWRQMMIGEDGQTFYENSLDQRYGEPIERPITAEHHGGQA